MRPQGSAAELEARRLRAAELLRERKPLTEIARLVGASLSSVKRWKRAWVEGGEWALASKPHPGPTPKLTSDQQLQLVAILRRGPLAEGYKTDLWTCKRVAEVVRRQFRVKYHPDHLGRLLHELGFSPQKPQQVAREQNAEAVERWRYRDWPRIKKSRDGRAQRLFFSMRRVFDCSP